jgi:hypothetical protein
MHLLKEKIRFRGDNTLNTVATYNKMYQQAWWKGSAVDSRQTCVDPYAKCPMTHLISISNIGNRSRTW